MRANTDPVVVASADGHLSVFTVGTNNQLYLYSPELLMSLQIKNNLEAVISCI